MAGDVFSTHITNTPGKEPFFTHDNLHKKINRILEYRKLRKQETKKDEEFGFADFEKKGDDWIFTSFAPVRSSKYQHLGVAEFLEMAALKSIAKEGGNPKIHFDLPVDDMQEHLKKRGINPDKPIHLKDYIKKLEAYKKKKER